MKQNTYREAKSLVLLISGAGFRLAQDWHTESMLHTLDESYGIYSYKADVSLSELAHR